MIKRKLLWQEDDATTRDPDHETAHKAFERLFGRRFVPDEALRREDHGDATSYLMPGGVEVVLSYPGASAIYQVKPEDFRATVEKVLESVQLPEADGITIDAALRLATASALDWCREKKARKFSIVHEVDLDDETLQTDVRATLKAPVEKISISFGRASK